MKSLILAALALACPPERPPLSDLEGYIIDVCLERDGAERRACIKKALANQRRCGAPTCA